MSTNLALLPLITFAASTTTLGDWLDQIGFSNNGAAIDITGISFRFEAKKAGASTQILGIALSTTAGTLVNGGASGILSFNALASYMAGVLPATYLGDLIASDGTGATRNLSDAGSSTITHRQGV